MASFFEVGFDVICSRCERGLDATTDHDDRIGGRHVKVNTTSCDCVKNAIALGSDEARVETDKKSDAITVLESELWQANDCIKSTNCVVVTQSKKMKKQSDKIAELEQKLCNSPGLKYHLAVTKALDNSKYDNVQQDKVIVEQGRRLEASQKIIDRYAHEIERLRER